MSEASFHRHLPREPVVSHQSPGPGQNGSFVTCNPNGLRGLQRVCCKLQKCIRPLAAGWKFPGLYLSDSLAWGLHLPLTAFPGSSLGLSHTRDQWVSAEERYPSLHCHFIQDIWVLPLTSMLCGLAQSKKPLWAPAYSSSEVRMVMVSL